MKKGVLLVNLGTPDACNIKAVRRFLREFLLDPRVVDLPWIVRQILVNGIIVPFRAKKTTEAYQQIWSEKGSPLLVNNLQLTETLARALGEDYQVALGMRYGNPSIVSALKQLKDCSSLFILPLFPQYAAATTGSVIEKIIQQVSKLSCPYSRRPALYARDPGKDLKFTWIPRIKLVPEKAGTRTSDIGVDLQIRSSFYNDPLFIKSYAEKIKTMLKDKTDLLLFSYHGLPERQLKKSGCHVICLSHCHPEKHSFEGSPLNCYRAQCYETSRLIAHQLGLSSEQYTVSFQSRLGSTPWIKPYTDEVLFELRKKEIKNIALISPSFVTDCLETLEEIDIRLREQWLTLGGESFTYVPALNDDPLWISALKEWITSLKYMEKPSPIVPVE